MVRILLPLPLPLLLPDVSFSSFTLGVLFSIPLRRSLLFESELVYPEGVAISEVLQTLEGSDSNKEEDAVERVGEKDDGLKEVAAVLEDSDSVGKLSHIERCGFIDSSAYFRHKSHIFTHSHTLSLSLSFSQCVSSH